MNITVSKTAIINGEEIEFTASERFNEGVEIYPIEPKPLTSKQIRKRVRKMVSSLPEDDGAESTIVDHGRGWHEIRLVLARGKLILATEQLRKHTKGDA